METAIGSVQTKLASVPQLADPAKEEEKTQAAEEEKKAPAKTTPRENVQSKKSGRRKNKGKAN